MIFGDGTWVSDYIAVDALAGSVVRILAREEIVNGSSTSAARRTSRRTTSSPRRRRLGARQAPARAGSDDVAPARVSAVQRAAARLISLGHYARRTVRLSGVAPGRRSVRRGAADDRPVASAPVKASTMVRVCLAGADQMGPGNQLATAVQAAGEPRARRSSTHTMAAAGELGPLTMIDSVREALHGAVEWLH